jgi:hypothetical protein
MLNGPNINLVRQIGQSNLLKRNANKCLRALFKEWLLGKAKQANTTVLTL